MFCLDDGSPLQAVAPGPQAHTIAPEAQTIMGPLPRDEVLRADVAATATTTPRAQSSENQGAAGPLPSTQQTVPEGVVPAAQVPTDLPSGPPNRPGHATTQPGMSAARPVSSRATPQTLPPPHALPSPHATANDAVPPQDLPASPPPLPAQTAAAPAKQERNQTIYRPNPPATLVEAETFISNMDGPDETNYDDQSAYLGTLIADRYLVLQLLGRGGMGAVFKAEQIHLRKLVAVKLLHETLSSRKQLVSRFTREARAISRLSSPHTVMVYDFGRWGELFYLVMELLEGEPLDALLEREGPLPAARTTHAVLQMCDSLGEAHRFGIVHRDLKPENIMMVRNHSEPDFVKILDFGLAKVKGVEDPYTIHSQRDIFGTPYYMSPEQIRAGDVDGRADIYALGALMFRMLTGHYVFGGEQGTFDLLKCHLMEPAPKMSTKAPQAKIPPALEQIVAKCLEKEPGKRYATMEELALALQAAEKSGFSASNVGPATVVPLDPGPTPAAAAGTAKAVSSHVKGAATGAADAPRRPARAAAKYDSGLYDPDAGTSVEDIENRAQKAQKWRSIGFVAALLLGIGILLAMIMASGEQPGGVEAEPNNEPKLANPLDAAGTTRGKIGAKRSPTLADRDCFRLPPLRDSDMLTVKLSGAQTMDLLVTLHDKGGETTAQGSHGGRGDGELLRFLDVRKQPLTVCVTEQIAPGGVASESLTDEYKLKLEVQPRPDNAEREFNDTGKGQDINTGGQLQGSLDGPLDRDVFALMGNLDGRIVRATVDVAQTDAPAWLRLALLDSSDRTLATAALRADAHKMVLAFVAGSPQLPDRLVLSRGSVKGDEPLRAEDIAYTLQYELLDLTEQQEQEPNNTAVGATPMVLGAWHVGSADDADGDWLRIEGGDRSQTRIRLEAIAPVGSAWHLLVRDAGNQRDLRDVQVQGGVPATEMLVDGTGEGFLLWLKQVPQVPARKGKPLDARYQIRARFVSTDGATK